MSKTSQTVAAVSGLALGGVLLGYGIKKLLERGSSKKEDLYFVGIDLGATNAKAGIVNNKGELLGSASHGLTDYSDKGVVDSLVEVATEAVKNAGLEWKDVTEIGVGSPGTIDFDVILCNIVFTLEWCCY